MKISRMVLPIVAFCVLLSGFCNIPYISNWIFRLILLLYVVFNEKILSYAWEKRIQEYRTDMVVEGVNTASAAYKLGKKYDVEMPITEQANAILFDNKDAREAVNSLMTREKRKER